MKKIYRAVLLVVTISVCAFAQTTGWLSSYWDGCKPTCSWYQNLAPTSIHGLSSSCDINDVEIPLGDIGTADCAKNDGGTAFTCWNQIPFVDANNPNLAYGFGATSAAVCGQCFEITFTGGYEHGAAMPMHTALANKRVIIMGRNTGSDVAANQIDFMIPGGGLGQFDCFTRQIGLPYRSPTLGKEYGGLLGACIDSALANQQFGGNWQAPGVMEFVQSCHRRGCERAFSNFPVLLEGCMFHVDFMMSAPNPLATISVLDQCPQRLVDIYKPQSAKYTLIKQAIDYTNLAGNGNVNDGNKSMSGINSSTVLTYDVNVLIAGQYTMEFALATGENTEITITINGQPAGVLSNGNTGNWGDFSRVALGNPVTLREGSNTVVLDFQTNGANFLNFMFTGDEDVRSQAGVSGDNGNGNGDNGDNVDNTSIRQCPSRIASARTSSSVRLTTSANNITATLSANHGYTSYSLIDLRGREIRSGAIDASARNLNISGINKGVVLLRLNDARGTQTTLRTVVR